MRLLHFHFKNHNRPLKGTGAKHDDCRSSSVSTRAKLPVAPVESAPMHDYIEAINVPDCSGVVTARAFVTVNLLIEYFEMSVFIIIIIIKWGVHNVKRSLFFL